MVAFRRKLRSAVEDGRGEVANVQVAGLTEANSEVEIGFLLNDQIHDVYRQSG